MRFFTVHRTGPGHLLENGPESGAAVSAGLRPATSYTYLPVLALTCRDELRQCHLALAWQGCDTGCVPGGTVG
jgi:hypothetical protein